MKQIYVDSYYGRGYSRCMQRINDILDHPKYLEIEARLKSIDFFDEYGAEATRKAFGRSRSPSISGSISYHLPAAGSLSWHLAIKRRIINAAV